MLINIKKYKIRIVFVSCLVSLILSVSVVSAITLSTEPIAQGYQSVGQLQPGEIVELNPKNPSSVEASSDVSLNQIFGVVVPSNSANLTLGNTKNSSQVYVTNYGTQNVLVSNQNGPISIGDYISISSIDGIGDKATNNQEIVLGRASGSFDGKTGVIGTDTVDSKSGQKINYQIGEIPVVINISPNPNLSNNQQSNSIITKLSKINNKAVSNTRVYLGLSIIVIGALLAMTVIYSGVKNGITSIGRNPLAKKTIIFDILKLIAIGLLIFVVSVGLAYIIISYV